MDNNQLIELGFAKILNAAMKHISSKPSGHYIEIVYMDDSTESGISTSSFVNDRLEKYLLSEDSCNISAYATMDAGANLDPDEEQLSTGIYAPNEGIKEPMTIGFYIELRENDNIDHEAELHMFSCIPYYSEPRRAVALKTDQKTKTILAKNIKTSDNFNKVWQSWMRVMWGRNWKIRYGTEPEDD